MLWGLFQQNLVPPRVDPELLKEFHNKFKEVDQVEKVLSDPNLHDHLVAQSDIVTLNQGWSGCLKLGKGLANINKMQILYVHGILAKVGIHIWGPNLEEPHDSLFNLACRIVALDTFCQLAASGTYNYMNLDLSNLNKMSLMVSAYNHFVHYVLESRFKKEVKAVGSYEKDQSKKSIQKNRERLRQSLYAYGVAKKFPGPYLQILNDTLAHSDD